MLNGSSLNLKCLWHEFFFLRKHLADHLYKPIPTEEKNFKNLKFSFFGR